MATKVRAKQLSSGVWIGEFHSGPRYWRATLTRTGAQASFPTRAAALADARRVYSFAGSEAL